MKQKVNLQCDVTSNPTCSKLSKPSFQQIEIFLQNISEKWNDPYKKEWQVLQFYKKITSRRTLLCLCAGAVDGVAQTFSGHVFVKQKLNLFEIQERFASISIFSYSDKSESA
jgi:hypothetical protein